MRSLIKWRRHTPPLINGLRKKNRVSEWAIMGLFRISRDARAAAEVTSLLLVENPRGILGFFQKSQLLISN
jgi:hypothetical protein